MRTFFSSLAAFFLSAFAGGIVVQVIAEKTNATEEFILAFMASALVSIVVAAAFFLARLTGEPLRAISTVGRSLLVVMAVLSIALLGLSFWADGMHVPDSKETWLLIALTVPGFLTILTHWLFVRWRVGRRAMQFGRGPEVGA